MRRLYLVRHAKSSWSDPELADIDRPLNKRGKRDAPAAGERLKKRKVRPDLIVSSPAKRARRTAGAIAEEIGFPGKNIATDDAVYHASSVELLSVIRGFDDAHGEVMMFGHNPGFTDLASLLTGAHVDNLPTCAIFCVDFDIGSWQEVGEAKGTLVFLDYPKMHL
ncbi:MAG: histidine phosphatase family protein [Candidatus Latescibacteria bacterium]|jgi:phosphohistidine phosphatase|nr:histidine phosphatase family protein [Candidatus Latescibacterota bacterium]